MNVRRCFVILAVLSAASACGMKPQLVRHYKQIAETDAGTPVTSEIKILTPEYSGDISPSDLLAGNRYFVSAFVVPISKEATQKSLLLSLSPEGQAALINQLSEKKVAANEYSEFLLSAGRQPEPPCPNSAPLRFERRVVFSTFGRHTLPATRFDSFSYSLKIKEGGSNSSDLASFVSWNGFDTYDETALLGSTRFKQSQSFSLQDVDSDKKSIAATALSPGKELIDSLTLNASSTREMEENVVSNRRFSPFLNSISKKYAFVMRQGVVGQDLFGNFSADFTIEITPYNSTEVFYSVRGLFDNDGKVVVDPSRISVARCVRNIAREAKPIYAEFSTSAIRRNVTRNSETAIEGDDYANYEKIDAKNTELVEILSAYDLTRNAYKIGLQLSNGIRYISLSEIGSGSEGDAIFSSESVATSFVSWLRTTRADTIKNSSISFSGGINKYTPSDAQKLKVFLCTTPAADDCGMIWE